MHDRGFLEADSQPLTRQFVAEVSIKVFEDELTDAKSHSSFVSQSKDPPLDTLGAGGGTKPPPPPPITLWRILEDCCGEMTDAKSQSSFMSQSKDTMNDYIDSLLQPLEDWPL